MIWSGMASGNKDAPDGHGVGSQMGGLLRRLGIVPPYPQEWQTRLREMDCRGIDWCRRNIHVIANWMVEAVRAPRFRSQPWSRVSYPDLERLAVMAINESARKIPHVVSRLHVLTALFNPVDSTRIRQNYGRFREALGDVPLTVIELIFPGQQRIAQDSILFTGDRVRHCLWIKERLLNLAFKYLPDDADAVAWIDADILFDRRDWVRGTLSALLEHPVVQLFNRVRWLDQDGHCSMSIEGVGCKEARKGREWGHPGFAWAARRSALEQMGGLFDLDLVGGGDTWMALAFCDLQWKEHFLTGSPAHEAAWQAWKARAQAVTKGRIGVVDGDIEHLFHGDYALRLYNERASWQYELQFNPLTDIEVDDQGLYAWTGRNPALQERIRHYFPSRQDDGPCRSTTGTKSTVSPVT